MLPKKCAVVTDSGTLGGLQVQSALFLLYLFFSFTFHCLRSYVIILEL